MTSILTLHLKEGNKEKMDTPLSDPFLLYQRGVVDYDFCLFCYSRGGRKGEGKEGKVRKER